MANSPMLVILFCALASNLALGMGESCAMTGNCLESTEFETDGGLALIQKKVRAHRVSGKTTGTTSDVPFANQAVNAVSAIEAKNSLNAILAWRADKALHAKTALNAYWSNYAATAKYAFTATKALHTCGESTDEGVAAACKKMVAIAAQSNNGDDDDDDAGTSGAGGIGAFFQARQKNRAKKYKAEKLSRRAKAIMKTLALKTSSDNFPSKEAFDTENDCWFAYDSKEAVPETAVNATCAKEAENSDLAENAGHSVYAVSADTAGQAQYASDAENALFAQIAADAEYALQIFDNSLEDSP